MPFTRQMLEDKITRVSEVGTEAEVTKKIAAVEAFQTALKDLQRLGGFTIPGSGMGFKFDDKRAENSNVIGPAIGGDRSKRDSEYKRWMAQRDAAVDYLKETLKRTGVIDVATVLDVELEKVLAELVQSYDSNLQLEIARVQGLQDDAVRLKNELDYAASPQRSTDYNAGSRRLEGISGAAQVALDNALNNLSSTQDSFNLESGKLNTLKNTLTDTNGAQLRAIDSNRLAEAKENEYVDILQQKLTEAKGIVPSDPTAVADVEKEINDHKTTMTNDAKKRIDVLAGISAALTDAQRAVADQEVIITPLRAALAAATSARDTARANLNKADADLRAHVVTTNTPAFILTAAQAAYDAAKRAADTAQTRLNPGIAANPLASLEKLMTDKVADLTLAVSGASPSAMKKTRQMLDEKLEPFLVSDREVVSAALNSFVQKSDNSDVTQGTLKAMFSEVNRFNKLKEQTKIFDAKDEVYRQADDKLNKLEKEEKDASVNIKKLDAEIAGIKKAAKVPVDPRLAQAEAELKSLQTRAPALSAEILKAKKELKDATTEARAAALDLGDKRYDDDAEAQHFQEREGLIAQSEILIIRHMNDLNGAYQTIANLPAGTAPSVEQLMAVKEYITAVKKLSNILEENLDRTVDTARIEAIRPVIQQMTFIEAQMPNYGFTYHDDPKRTQDIDIDSTRRTDFHVEDRDVLGFVFEGAVKAGVAYADRPALEVNLKTASGGILSTEKTLNSVHTGVKADKGMTYRFHQQFDQSQSTSPPTVVDRTKPGFGTVIQDKTSAGVRVMASAANLDERQQQQLALSSAMKLAKAWRMLPEAERKKNTITVFQGSNKKATVPAEQIYAALLLIKQIKGYENMEFKAAPGVPQLDLDATSAWTKTGKREEAEKAYTKAHLGSFSKENVQASMEKYSKDSDARANQADKDNKASQWNRPLLGITEKQRAAKADWKLKGEEIQKRIDRPAHGSTLEDDVSETPSTRLDK